MDYVECRRLLLLLSSVVRVGWMYVVIRPGPRWAGVAGCRGQARPYCLGGVVSRLCNNMGNMEIGSTRL